MKYSYKQSFNIEHEWEFGWGHYDSEFYTFDYLNNTFLNDTSDLAAYFGMQYGQFIVNKIVLVVDGFDIVRHFSSHKQVPAGQPSDVVADPFFDKSKIFFEMYAPNNRDSHGVPVIGDRYEFVKRIPVGKRFKHTYYPRCKERMKATPANLNKKMGDILIAQKSPDKGRSICYFGIGPLCVLPNKADTVDYVKYMCTMTINMYTYITLTDRNIQMMV